MRVLALVGLTLFLLVQPAVSQVPDDKLVVPGQRIGKWTLEMTINALVGMNGPETAGAFGLKKPITPIADMGQVDWLDDVWAHSWGNLALIAGTMGRDSQRIAILLVESTDYRTPQGVTIGRDGTSLQDIKALYGEPTVSTRLVRTGAWRLVYDQTGLAIQTLNEKARYFFIFRPGTAKQIWRW